MTTTRIVEATFGVLLVFVAIWMNVVLWQFQLYPSKGAWVTYFVILTAAFYSAHRGSKLFLGGLFPSIKREQ